MMAAAGSLFSGLFNGGGEGNGVRSPKGEDLFSKKNKFRRKNSSSKLASETTQGASSKEEKDKDDSRKSTKKKRSGEEQEDGSGKKKGAVDSGKKGEKDSGDRKDSESKASSSSASSPRKSRHSSKDDAPEKRQRTLFVGNVSSAVTKKALKRIFGEFGSVESVRFRSQPLNLEEKMPYQDTALTRRIAAVKGLVNAERTQKAYVVFKEEESAKKALALNMTKVEGKHIMVDFAGEKSTSRGGSSVQYDPAMSVFLGNLAVDVEEEEIIELFDSANHLPQIQGEIEAVRVVHDKSTGLGKGIGYVLFKTKKAAKAALELNGEKLKDRALRVMKVQSKPAPLSNKDDSKNDGNVSREEKRRRVNAFNRRTASKGSGGGNTPSWQGMKTKAKAGNNQNMGRRKDKQLLSEMIKKHTIKSTTKNMQSKKKRGTQSKGKGKLKVKAKGKVNKKR